MRTMTCLRLAAIALLLCCGSRAVAQTDSTAFRGYLQNKEYHVYMRINFYEQDVVIRWQEMFGPLAGFLAREGDNLCWIVTDVQIDGNQAHLEITNDYGSEDLTATLTQTDDTTFVLRQLKGSTLKVPENRKWRKLPQTMTFIKNKKLK